MATSRGPASDLERAQHHELLRLVSRRARGEGTTATGIPALSLLRSSRPSELRHGIIQPSLCLVVQGGKQIQVDRESYAYGAGSYVMSAIEYPTSGRITVATPSVPYLAIRIALDVHELADVIAHAELALARPPARRAPAVFVGAAERPLLGCMLRLVQLADEPDSAAFLAAAVIREIMFRLLRTEHGPLIYRSVKPAHLGIGRALDWLRRHFDQPLDVTALAKTSRMSVSSLRHEFKSTTALAPLQFQKQLRLHEARRLLMTGEVDAGTAAFRVGYASPSQFSREYRRLFGAPPLRDVRKLVGTAGDP
jgi:AraC-like DNA-binding protein